MDEKKTNGCFAAFLGAVVTAVTIAGVIAIAVWTSGCRSADCGSRTVVGNHTALPKLSSDASDLDVEVYESTEGAAVYTRKDSRVEITFTNNYTNTILGIWDRRGMMVLGVIIEPTQGEAPCEVVDGRNPEESK